MNPDVDPNDPRLPSRGLWGMAILALPMFGVALMFVAYGIMWSLGLSGRSASGEPVTLRFEGCAEAQTLVEARFADMGLEGAWAPAPGGFTVTGQLTGDPTIDAALPTTLSTPGALEIRSGDTVLAANQDLRDASVRMDLFMVPYVLFRLEEAAAKRVRQAMRDDPGGKLRFWVDGADVGWQSNQNPVATGELEMNPQISDEEARMHAVAAWSVTLDHGPLPCEVRGYTAP